MNNFFNYYFLTFIFYLCEIFLFKLILQVWIYDIFWLNIFLRSIFATIFSIIIRNTIFKDSKLFYIKFTVVAIANPLVSSTLLKLFSTIYPITPIIGLKLMSDLIVSIWLYFVLKRYA
jgi:hypothetical protein